MALKVSTYLVSAVAGSLLACTLIYAATPKVERPASIAAQSPSPDCAELFDLFSADQADRFPKPGEGTIDWRTVEGKDAMRRGLVVQLYREDKLKTGTDFYRAAVIMQHGKTPEDFLLAHEMAMAAVVLGRHTTRWLVAATQDRFLISIGRRQRFGTQYRTDAADPAPSLFPIEEGVTDGMRKAMDLPTLQEAREREATIARLARKGQV